MTFESGLDEREYVVYRDTGAGYHVTDPRLQTRIADKKEEVFRFLWQHLGLEPGTDLKSLFRQAIGVPQGTFTAIFLKGRPSEKLPSTACSRSRNTGRRPRNYAKHRDSLRYKRPAFGEGIARAEGELSRSDMVAAEHESQTAALLKNSRKRSLIWNGFRMKSGTSSRH